MYRIYLNNKDNQEAKEAMWKATMGDSI